MEAFGTWLKKQGWIKRGDCIYVVSDMLELSKVYREQGSKLSPDEIIDTLQEMVGEEEIGRAHV